MSLFPVLTRLLAHYRGDGPGFEPQAHSADWTASVMRRVCLSFKGILLERQCPTLEMRKLRLNELTQPSKALFSTT